MSAAIDLIHATVRLEQPLPSGLRTVGTGFIVTAATPDGSPRTILITADHVFASMPGDKAVVGFRAADAAGEWRYTPVDVRIRDAEGDPMWTKHPLQDVAAIELPAGVARGAVSVADLAGNRGLASLKIEPGDEMMVLGYPRGLSANNAGFPILRSGRVASYPLAPASRYPTYLLDFSVFAGNSGGPVYIVRSTVAPGRSTSHIVITGLLTQQIKMKRDRLEIGNVTQADYIVETLSLLDGTEPTEVAATRGTLPESDPVPASGPEPSNLERLAEAWEDTLADLAILFRRAWIVAKQTVLEWLTPDPHRA